jgi:tetratricopeptide (TPR) repeat protein
MHDMHSAEGDWKLKKAGMFFAQVFLFCSTAVCLADTPRMLIFPLDSSSMGASLKWLSEGIALSLGNQLEGKDLTVFSRSERIRLVENLDLPPAGRLSRGSMIRVAQQAKANLLLMGEFSGTEENLKIALRVLDLKTLKLSGQITANGPISAMPQMENTLAWLVISNCGLGNFGTREDFQLRIRKIPNEAYAYFIQSLDATGKDSQIQLLKKAVAEYGNFPEAQFRLGQAYFSGRDCQSAMRHLDLMPNDGKTDPEYEFMQGTCSVLWEQYPQAVQSLSQALSYGRFFEVLNNIGVAYLRKGDLAPALSSLQEAKGLARTDPTVLKNLAIVYLMRGNIPAAGSTVEEAIRVHPKNGALQFLRSFLLQRQGEADKAAAAAANARSLGVDVDKLQPEDPEDWASLVFNWSH